MSLVEGAPEQGWGGRRYRTRGTFERRERNGEWGVGIPLKTPTLAMEVLFGALAAGLAAAEVFGVWRALSGQGGWRPIVGVVLLLPFLALFVAGAGGAHRLRGRPQRGVLVTARGLNAPFADYRWDQVERVLARSALRRGSLRRVNYVLLRLTPETETVLQRSGRLGRVGDWIDEATQHTIRLVDAAQFDADPWKAVQGLRALAADPALRARLAGPDGPSVFTDLRWQAERAVIQGWRDARDRFVASDPGLSRLRHGIKAVIALATTVGLQLAFAALRDTPSAAARTHVMIGSIVALNLATTLRDTRRHVIISTAALAAVGAAIGTTSATLAGADPTASFVAFVAATFVAVWVRRFGPRWFTAGFVMWQAHFFCRFLHPDIGQLPGMVVSAFVSTVWVALLLVTVLAANPEATLLRTVTALRAQARGVASACLDVLDRPASPLARRRLRAQQVKTSEVALLFDGQLADARALPEGVAAVVLRQWIVDLEIGVDEMAGAIVDLVDRPTFDAPVPAAIVADVRRALVEIGWSQYAEARAGVSALRADAHWAVRPVRRFVIGAELVLACVEEWTSGAVMERARAGAEPSYEPVVQLQGGTLPGSQSLAGQTGSIDTRHWWSAGRLRFTTRQAIQAATAAAIALAVGERISSQRSYWAAIAAFVTFTGASTTSETTRKAIDRTLGTVLGLFASLALAHVVGGHPLASAGVMVVGVFLAFYVQALSTTWMICFITLVLGQLYEVLRTFSEDVLLVRLAETATGAAAGILVTYAVLPAHARDTLILARRAMLTTLAGLLDDLARTVERGRAAEPEVRARLYREVIALDEAGRQLAAGHDTLIRPRIFDADHAARRHRVAVLGVCTSAGRALVQAVLAALTPEHGGEVGRTSAEPVATSEEAAVAVEPVATSAEPASAGSEAAEPLLPPEVAGPEAAEPLLPPEVAEGCRALAEEARRLADVPDLRDQRPARADRPGISIQVSDILASAPDIPLVVARRAQRLADALALLTPRRR